MKEILEGCRGSERVCLDDGMGFQIDPRNNVLIVERLQFSISCNGPNFVNQVLRGQSLVVNLLEQTTTAVPDSSDRLERRRVAVL